MDKPRNIVLLRSVEDLADARELRAVISAALTSTPIDLDGLRCAVWTFVGAERKADVPAAVVIARLTALVDEANIVPIPVRLALTKRIILWCVEEYFGHLGGDVLSPDTARGASLSITRS